jgi:ATP-dependent DNA helicase RecQ
MTQRRLVSLGTSSPAMLRRSEEALARLDEYASTMDCRQRFLCAHFTGRSDHPRCENCDLCTLDTVSTPVAKQVKAQVTALGEQDKETIVQAVGHLVRPVGKTNLAKALRGSRAKTLSRGGLLRLPEHGSLHHYSEDDIVHAIKDLLNMGLLVKKGRKYPTVWLPDKPVRGNKTQSQGETGVPKRIRKNKKNKRFSNTQLARALENYRRRKARSLKWKPYMVFQLRVILAVDANRPETLEELHKIPGLGIAKIDKFGPDILDLVREFEFENVSSL